MCGRCLAGRKSRRRSRGKIRSPHRQGLPAAAAQSQHRSDPAGTLSEMAALARGSARCCFRTCVSTADGKNAPIFRSTSRSGATPRFSSPGAISAAARRAKPPSTRSTITAFAAWSRRRSATYLRRTRSRTDCSPRLFRKATLAELAAAVAADPERVTVDLERRTIACGNRNYTLLDRSGQPQSAPQRLG